MEFIIRVLLFLSKKLIKNTFVGNFENLNECLNYSNKKKSIIENDTNCHIY